MYGWTLQLSTSRRCGGGVGIAARKKLGESVCGAACFAVQSNGTLPPGQARPAAVRRRNSTRSRTPCYPNAIPPSLLCPPTWSARWRHALDDADVVGTFLRDDCGVRGTPDRPVRIPLTILLDLAAALRLHAWEQAGIDPCQFPGLPDFAGGLHDVVRRVGLEPGDCGPGLRPGELAVRVLNARTDYFAWCGRAELGADVALGPADEETVLEALADFLWQNRPLCHFPKVMPLFQLK